MLESDHSRAILAALRSAWPRPAGARRGRDLRARIPFSPTRFRVGEAAAAALAATGLAAAELWRLRTGRRQRVRVDVHRRRGVAAQLRLPAARGADRRGHLRAARAAHRLLSDPRRPVVPVPPELPGHAGEGARAARLRRGAGGARRGDRALGRAAARGRVRRARSVRRARAQRGGVGRAPAGASARGASRRRGDPGRRQPARAAAARRAAARGNPRARPDSRPGRADLRPHARRARRRRAADRLAEASLRRAVRHGHESWQALGLPGPDEPADAAQLRALVRGADVFTQGYRSGTLARRGFGPDELFALRPGLVYTAINCYGHVVPGSSGRAGSSWRRR